MTDFLLFIFLKRGSDPLSRLGSVMNTIEKIGLWVMFSPVIYVVAMSINLHLVRLGITEFTLPFLWKFL